MRVVRHTFLPCAVRQQDPPVRVGRLWVARKVRGIRGREQCRVCRGCRSNRIWQFHGGPHLLSLQGVSNRDFRSTGRRWYSRCATAELWDDTLVGTLSIPIASCFRGTRVRLEGLCTDDDRCGRSWHPYADRHKLDGVCGEKRVQADHYSHPVATFTSLRTTHLPPHRWQRMAKWHLWNAVGAARNSKAGD